MSASTLPQGQWWSDAYETRQRCINLVVRHRGHADYPSTSLSLSVHALHHRLNKQRWTSRATQVSDLPPVPVSGGYTGGDLHEDLEQPQKAKDESFNCNILGHTKINKKNRNIYLQRISARLLMVAFAPLILFSNYESA